MPFSSAAADIRIEIDGTVPAETRQATRISGRAVVRLHRAVAVQRVRIEFVGEETVSLRAWVPLSTTTQTREIVRQSADVRGAGVLAAGTHVFPFAVEVPWWVPSTLEREPARIRYVVRGVVERATLGALLLSGPSAQWAGEREVECRRVRVARRLARRKRVDQSVGCPDGSCHVRVWGTISRDTVKPGTQLRVDLTARTSDARFGVRLLGAHFSECVMCHVQAKGEERLVNRITHLTSLRLDALDALDGAERAGQQQPARGLRKTRSRLAVLLRAPGSVSPSSLSLSLSPPPPPLPAQPAAPGSQLPEQRAADCRPPVVRQVRASQTLAVPQGLSQFSSEFVSREYRLVVVADVAPLDETAGADSVHTNDSAQPVPEYRRQHARSAHNLSAPQEAAARSSSSSSSAVSLVAGSRHWNRHSEGSQQMQRGRRRPSEPGLLPEQMQRWAVSEQSSAIAAWTIDVVDHFDVQFDELVAPGRGGAAARRQQQQQQHGLSEPEISAGQYRFVPPAADAPSSSSSLEHSAPSEHGTHRRTSSGLVGRIRRGFRSSTPSPSAASPPSRPSRPGLSAATSSSHAAAHQRSVSGSIVSEKTRQPRALSSPPQSAGQREPKELVMYPLTFQKTLD
ncbi:hypothetical protein LPJ79_004508 [Coemansia sp. RSA 1821]|nr:hypothetical protein LPJ79_004508 [Coemansia sp. RSA 1821]KAJ2668190.1 hypothetical protein IWW42_005392 [Coemansia sp. RSA 1085]